jgi:hypothetical protein
MVKQIHMRHGIKHMTNICYRYVCCYYFVSFRVKLNLTDLARAATRMSESQSPVYWKKLAWPFTRFPQEKTRRGHKNKGLCWLRNRKMKILEGKQMGILRKTDFLTANRRQIKFNSSRFSLWQLKGAVETNILVAENRGFSASPTKHEGNAVLRI